MGKDRKYSLRSRSFHKSGCRNAEHLVMLLYMLLSFAFSWILTDLYGIIASNWIQNEVIFVMFPMKHFPP